MRPTLYEHAGGEQAFLRLAAEHHQRCAVEEMLEHPYSHGVHPQHVERLAAYWAECLGGPPRYSEQIADETFVVRLHSGNGDMDDLGQRFTRVFMEAVDAAGLPDDAEFRTALRAYMDWSVERMTAYPDDSADVPAGQRVPRWDWDGLVDDGSA